MRRPLPQIERNIGARLREWRKELQIPRAFLARTIGIGSERLASYESGRAPLKFGVFLAIWKLLDLNPAWLATGKRPLRMPFTGFENLVPTSSIEPERRFSEVYNTAIRELFETRGDVRVLALVNRAHEQVTSIATQLEGKPSEADLAEARVKLIKAGISAEGIIFETLASPKLRKTLSSAPLMTLSGPQLLINLRQRLQRATSRRGAKTELARTFGVTQATVTEWLNGPGKPSAENVLGLLKWVEQIEAIGNNPTAVSARPGRKMTRNSKSKSHEKTKSSRPKR